jgi:hypothetical protein
LRKRSAVSWVLQSSSASSRSVFCVYVAYAYWFPDPDHPIHLDPNWRMVLLPVFIVQSGLLGVGVGLIVAALTTRLPDLLMGVGFGVQLWMFASSVAFPAVARHRPHAGHAPEAQSNGAGD